jgi:phosphoglycolate phosphatase
MDIPREKFKITCVIYDCDGVLFDSLEANRNLYNHICTSLGRSPLTEEEAQFCHTNTVFGAVRHLFREQPEMEERALQFLKGMDLKKYIAYLKMEPHLTETLSILKERRLITAISTNRTTTMPHIMERFQLGDYFDMVVTALDVSRPKPDPESVEKILAAFTLEPQAVLYIGDSEIDRQTAEGAGVTFVAYKNREISNGLFIDDHLAVLDLLATDRPR